MERLKTDPRIADLLGKIGRSSDSPDALDVMDELESFGINPLDSPHIVENIVTKPRSSRLPNGVIQD